MVKVVINSHFGGFGLSDEAFKWLIKNKGWKVTEYNEKGNYKDETADIYDSSTSKDYKNYKSILPRYSLVKSEYSSEIRCHPDIIMVIETLGKKANGRFADLKIIEVPDDVKWSIEEYDGNEWVAEEHRTWQ